MAFYVALSILLIASSSLVNGVHLDIIHIFSNINIYYLKFIEHIYLPLLDGYIIYLSLFMGIFTFFCRKGVMKKERKLKRNPDTMFDIDWLSASYFIVAIIVGGLCFISFENIKGKHITIYMNLILVISLNFYFSSFWCSSGKVCSNNNTSKLKSLELEHSEWSTIYNSVLYGVLILVGGITFKSFGADATYSCLDIFIVSFIVFGGPIIWLLRPIHITMQRIRKISEEKIYP